jgi:hypothetical protein
MTELVNLRYYPNATNGRGAGGRIKSTKEDRAARKPMRHMKYDEAARIIFAENDTKEGRAAAWARYDATGDPRLAANAGPTSWACPDCPDFVLRNPDLQASEKQINLCSTLVSILSRMNPSVADDADRWVQGQYRQGTFTMKLAHQTIDRLRLRIREAEAAPADAGQGVTVRTPYAPVDRFPEVHDGYYAVDTEDGHLAFYRVSTWRDSNNRKVQVFASDTLHRIQGNAARDAILAKIRDAGPQAAAERFGREIGRCGRCGRTLTDETSRARGIGPDCAGKGYWG